ncbi:peptidoglycan DD-metalloendopeptidase family protein [Marinicrinis lubricantis]|uniref:Peptidoglycan DD-metalloendopeptidase family protein n=1 Tax=Marinicrinis lubricantis TaxID=2086470 RepID=A0ABW1IQQ3_9BACL
MGVWNKARSWASSRYEKAKLSILLHRQKQEMKSKISKATLTYNKKSKNYKLRIGITVGSLAVLAGVSYAGHEYVDSNMNTVYHVYASDQYLGAVSQEELVEDRIIDIKHQYYADFPDVRLDFGEDDIRFESERAFMAKGEDEKVLAQLDQLIEPKAMGAQLIVNGELVGVLKNEKEVQKVLNEIKLKYTPQTTKSANTVSVLSANDSSLAVGKTESNLEKVEFVEPVEVESVDYTLDQFKQQQANFDQVDEVVEKLITGDIEPIKYVVQEGDCVSCIASKFDISKQVIYKNNPWITNDMIKVGEELDLTVLQPELSVRTVETVQEVQEIQYKTEYQYDNEMKLGQSKVLQKGQEGKKLVTFRLTSVNGNLMSEELVKEEVIVDSVPAIVVQGTKVIKGEGTGNFEWPVSGATLTSSYGMRWGSMHKGIDLVSDDRTIMAADNGEVIFAGTKSGYGNAIIIDHHNGYQTLYGHLSKISVSVGTKVEQGDAIGVMGNTGNSTGTHLHFEIIVDGEHTNPLKYLD